MKLFNAIRLGNAIEEYNKRFEEKMHLDFYEVVSLMLEPDEDIDLYIQEIESRIEKKKQADQLFLCNYISYQKYKEIVHSL